MNYQQFKILKELGYEVIPEINFIKENSFNTPNCYLIYDSKINLFVIGIRNTTITISQASSFILELITKIDLANKLNHVT